MSALHSVAGERRRTLHREGMVGSRRRRVLPLSARLVAMATILVSLMMGGCASARPPSSGTDQSGAPAPRLPPVPFADGPLQIDLVYPPEGHAIGTSVDSTFVFGNVGTGAAALTIMGMPVEVAPNGAFLAYLPVPGDGRYELVASAHGQTVQAERVVDHPPPAASSLSPASGEDRFQLTLDDSSRVAAGWWGVVRSPRSDGMAIGTAVPGSGTPYHWFFPDGTELFVVGQLGDQLRVRLTEALSVWVDQSAVTRLGALAPDGAGGEAGLVPMAEGPRGYVGTVAATPFSDRIDIRLVTSSRLPHRVDSDGRSITLSVYGGATRTNNLLYGATDPLIERMEWEQVTDELYRLHIRLTEPLWGYRTEFDVGGNLVLSIRRPPAIDPGAPLRGMYIAVDAGHPPGGAIGPTRLTEAEATLGVSRRLARLLEARGARVLELRTDDTPVPLGDRPLRATEAGVDLLVSVHFDAFGDGVNPFENHGTHVFYNQSQSIDLARAVQRELLNELRLRDLGISRRDLALVRPTWMPSILTESAFMMIPQNEAALRDPAVLQRIAEAHMRGIEGFLRGRARE